MDDWEDETPASTSEYAEEGRSYGKGRGFTPHNNNNGDSVGHRGRGGRGGRGGGGYGGNRGDDEDGEDGGSRRGGRGGYRGGRGGRGGGSSNRYGDADDEENGDDGGSRRGRGGYRGGRGGGNRYGDDDGEENGEDGGSRRGGRGGGRGGRGGGGRGSGDEGGEGGEPEVRKEIYIPPEPSNEDADIFGTGVEMGINFEKYNTLEAEVSGDNPPPIIRSFAEAGLRSLLLDNVKKSGYTKPTPIQRAAIPIILAGRDLMACAQTGSGKTAAFMLPIVNNLLNEPMELVLSQSHCEPQVVIVAPTRELSIQIFDEARKFAKDSILKCVNVYGGTGTNHQRSQVLKGCHILVATMGRLLDFAERGCIKFSSVRYLVLDEADRMLELGFRESIEKLLDDESMPKERQTLMFSATFPSEIQEIAGSYLTNYLFVSVGIIGGACEDVEQTFHQVGKYGKRDKLKEVLDLEAENGKVERTLVFVEMKRTADFIAAFLSETNYPTTSIHGDREQREREEALRDFKSGRMCILVATAVAARGLDIKGVAHVINYDLPQNIDEYVHRIGRTGRVGNRGKATSFYDFEKDSPIVPELVKILKQANQQIPAWLADGGLSGGGGGGGGRRTGGRDIRRFDNDNNGQGDSYPDSAYTAAPAEQEEEW